MIMATIPDRNKTITREFMILKQKKKQKMRTEKNVELMKPNETCKWKCLYVYILSYNILSIKTNFALG